MYPLVLPTNHGTHQENATPSALSSAKPFLRPRSISYKILVSTSSSKLYIFFPVAIVPTDIFNLHSTLYLSNHATEFNMDHLPAINPPVGHHSQFINPQQSVNLILKEKVLSLTGDAFDIKVDPGNGQAPFPICKVDPSLLTSKKSFSDMQGRHLFDLRKEHFHMVHEYMKLVDGNGEKFCEFKKNFKGV